MSKITVPTLWKEQLWLTVLLCGLTIGVCGQGTDRLSNIRYRLNNLASDLPGLNQKIEMNVAAVPIADFMRGLAQSYKLNINIAPDVQQKMTNHFSGIPVMDVLYFIAQQYNLDYDFYGSIINVRNYRDPKLDLPPPPKDILITYHASDGLITLDLKNDTLQDVAKKITRLSGINIVVLPNAINKLVTLYVKDVPPGDAIEQMSWSHRLKFTKTDERTYVLESLADNEEFVTKNQNRNNANYTIARSLHQGSNSNIPARLSVDAEQVGNERLLNISAVNTPLKDLVKSLSEQAGVAYFIYAELHGNVTAEARSLTYSQALHKVLLGTPYSFTSDNGVYMIGEKNFEGIRSQRLVQLHHRSVDSLGYFLPDDMKKDVVIKEFNELNAFLVTGPEPQINKIETLVKQIDRKVPMITIEVIIMDVTKGRTTEAGVKAGVRVPGDSIPVGGTILNGLNFTLSSRSINRFIDQVGLNNVFNLGRVTPEFYVNLRAMEQLENVETRQTPKLSTLNGHAANLSIGSTRYYAVSTQNTLGSLSPTTITTQQFYPVEANLSLNIRPFVSADEDVTLNMEMDITNFTAQTDIKTPPPTATSKFNSTIRVKNDDMVLLGGIERSEKGESSSGIPFLSRIPVLKWIFSSRTNRNTKVVSIVFIRPTIIYN
ncbi:type II secretion system protein GspD [Niabella aquatica]